MPARRSLSYLDRLGAEAVDVLRDAVAQAERPVLLHSLGKESSVLLHLARTAFAPGLLPFPLLHIDARVMHPELNAFRRELGELPDVDLIGLVEQDGLAATLERALQASGFDVAISGVRRDEGRSGSTEPVFSLRSPARPSGPASPRPELWRLYNGLKLQGESLRVFPLANWTELDVWHYIERTGIPIAPLYLAEERPVVERHGTYVLVGGGRSTVADDEGPTVRRVRFPEIGRYPLTGGIESDATTVARALDEMAYPATGRRADEALSGSLASADSLDGSETSFMRLVVCGGAGDGKSTLIDCLARRSQMLDDRAAAAPPSERAAIVADNQPLPDVSYHHISTRRRALIVADTLAGDGYTRNLVTGASTADCAIIVVDSTNRGLTRTRRYAFLAAALGIRHAAIAVTKMDLVEYSERVFREVEHTYGTAARELGLEDVVCIPVSGLRGDNVVERSNATAWYDGPTVAEYVETVEIDRDTRRPTPFRLPVQWVSPPETTSGGLAGTVAGGVVRRGDPVGVYPANLRSTVATIIGSNGEVDAATSGQTVMLTLTDDVDPERGSMLAAVDAPPQIADQFEAMVFWLSDEPMLQGRTYLLRVGTNVVDATITPLKYKVNLETLEHVAARQLDVNELGVCAIELSSPIAFDPYVENRHTGGFILIDRLTYETVGAGLLRFALRRSSNVRWQIHEIDKRTRAVAKHQQPCVLWLTGLSGAGKSTIADLVERKLQGRGYHTYLLDGDNVRHGLNKDLGFTDADRVENIRRVAEVARLMVDAGLIVIVAFISPFASEREMARHLVEDGEFFEIFVDAPLALAEERDPKGLYLKARRGELANFTGIDSPYEPPDNPELRLDTSALVPEEAADAVIDLIERRGMLGA